MMVYNFTCQFEFHPVSSAQSYQDLFIFAIFKFRSVGYEVPAATNTKIAPLLYIKIIV
jgi:hypothetical protein